MYLVVHKEKVTRERERKRVGRTCRKRERERERERERKREEREPRAAGSTVLIDLKSVRSLPLFEKLAEQVVSQSNLHL